MVLPLPARAGWAGAGTPEGRMKPKTLKTAAAAAVAGAVGPAFNSVGSPSSSRPAFNGVLVERLPRHERYCRPVPGWSEPPAWWGCLPGLLQLVLAVWKGAR